MRKPVTSAAPGQIRLVLSVVPARLRSAAASTHPELPNVSSSLGARQGEAQNRGGSQGGELPTGKVQEVMNAARRRDAGGSRG